MTLKVIRTEDRHAAPFALIDNGDVVKKAATFLKLIFLRGLSANTVRAYAFDLLEFYRFLKKDNLTIYKLNNDHIVDFILAHRRNNAAPRTINRRLIVVCDYLNSQFAGLGDKLLKKRSGSFYKGRRNKALLGPTRIKNKDESKTTLSVKVAHSIIIPLRPNEIKRFLEQLRTYRDQAIVYLMLFCGLRTHEALGLEIRDIDFIENKIMVTGKGLKQRALPMPESVRRTLHRYINFERPDVTHDRLITVLKGPNRGRPLAKESLRTIFKYHRDKASLRRLHPHLFRHTFCSNLIKEGVSLPVVQKLMGHSDIKVTMMYVHMGIDDVSKEYHQALDVLQNLYDSKKEK